MSQACSCLELGAPGDVQVLRQLAAKQLSIVPAGKSSHASDMQAAMPASTSGQGDKRLKKCGQSAEAA